jgi:hypothetical protein
LLSLLLSTFGSTRDFLASCGDAAIKRAIRGRSPAMTLRIHRTVGLHALDIFGEGERWVAAVDGSVLPGRFRSPDDAQEVAFRTLDRAIGDARVTLTAGVDDPRPC